MSLHLQITDPEGLLIVVRIPGNYNPDVLEDGKRHLLETYKESLSFRHAMASAVVLVDGEEVEDDE